MSVAVGGSTVTTALVSYSSSKIKVSSVLNKDVRQFGKRFMFDGQEETCWNSDQGSPQYVTISLPASAVVKEVHIRFQGGFVGSECALMAGDSELELEEIDRFYPKDNNSLQHFPILSCSKEYQVYKIVFKTSTDLFGRITVYLLQLYGTLDSGLT